MKYHKYSIVVAVLFVAVAVLAGGRYLDAFPSIPKPARASSGTVAWDVNLSHPYVERGSSGEVLLNLKIKGDEVEMLKRMAVNLVLVIDRSGSMSDKGKMEYAKSAAKQIIGSLGNQDRVAIVAYSSDVQLLYPAQFLTDKEYAFRVIDSIYPTNSTNLSGGLITGIDQLNALKREGYLNRVILLSDGLANMGITDIGQLSTIASNAAKRGIHITTMGLGLNYDENLMMNLAEYGAGNYYFIESPTQLAGIFQKEFGQLAKTVGKDPEITLSLAPGVVIDEVYGYTHTTKDGKVTIKLGDVFSGQERDILVRMKAPSGTSGIQQLANVSFKYNDVMAENRSVSLLENISYHVTEDKKAVTDNEDKDVSARGVAVKAANDFYKATTEYENGNREEAYSVQSGAYRSLVELNKSGFATERTRKQEAELRDALEGMSADAPAPSSESGKKLIKEQKAKARQQQK